MNDSQNTRTFTIYRCPVCGDFKSMQGSPRCHNVTHEPVEVIPLERATELEDALRDLFRLASSQHRQIHGGGKMTSREWEDMRTRITRTLFRKAAN